MNILRETAPLHGEAVDVQLPGNDAAVDPHPDWAVSAIAARSGPVFQLVVPDAHGARSVQEVRREDFLSVMRNLGHEIAGAAEGSYPKMCALSGLPRFSGFLGPLMQRDDIMYVADCFVDRVNVPADLTPDEVEFWCSVSHLPDEKKRNWIDALRENKAVREVEQQRRAEAEKAAAQRARERKQDPYYKLEQSCYPKRPRQVLRKARGRRWRLPGVVGSKAAWSIPATGGYSRGWDVGYALAKLYLQHVGKGEPSPCANTLSNIVESMFDKRLEISARAGQNAMKCHGGGNTEADSFRGQLLAFFQLIEVAASAGVRFSTVGKTVRVDERSLIRAANRALSFDDKAHWAGLDELEPDEE